MEEDHEENITENEDYDLDEEDESLEEFTQDEEIEECAECGIAIKDKKKKVIQEIDGEEYTFCSAICAKEFTETLASGEE